MFIRQLEVKSMTQETVLVVDDDKAIRKIISKVLYSNNIEPTEVSSGEEAIKLLKSTHFDLIILDIMLGGIDGFDVIKTIRANGVNTPIMVLSGRTEEYDTVFGLQIGADDYITKPFNPMTLGAKAKALIRRNKLSSKSRQSCIIAPPFKYDLSTLKLYKNDVEIFLSYKEGAMMRFFLENTNQVFSKEQLYQQVWGDVIVDENSVMVYISYLRDKIENDRKNPQYIKTVWGIGYKFTID